jgi:hypothetical protein
MLKKKKTCKRVVRKSPIKRATRRRGKWAEESGGVHVISDPKGISRYHMLSQYHAAKLEGLGMKHSSGRSILAHIKKTYGYKGSRDEVLKKFRSKIDNM